MQTNNNHHRLIAVYIGSIFLFLILTILSGCSFFEKNEKTASNYYQFGLQAIQEQNREKAILQFKKAVELDPYFAPAHYQLGLLYLETNKIYLAVRELNLAVRQDPKLYGAKRKLLELYFQNQVYSKAIPLSKDLIEHTGEDVDILIILSNSLIKTDQLSEGRAILEKAVQTYPHNVKARMELAYTLLIVNAQTEALTMMESAAALDLNDLFLQLSLARFYEKIGQDNRTEDELLKIQSNFPHESVSYLETARFYLRKNNAQAAKQSLEKAIDMGLKNPNLYLTLAQIYHQEKRYEEALQKLQEVMSLSSEKGKLGDKKNVILLADYLTFLNRYTEARAIYDKILEQWPGLTFVKPKIASILLAEGKYEQAAEYIENILRQRPDSARGHILHGIVMNKAGDVPKTIDSFEEAIRLNPEDADGYLYYALTLLEKHNYRIALPKLLMAVKLNPGSQMARLLLAYTHYKIGEISLAVEDLDLLLSTHPDNRRARSLRAHLHFETKNYEDAISDYRYLIENFAETGLEQYRLAEIYKTQGRYDAALKHFGNLLESSSEPVSPLEKMVEIYLEKGAYQDALAICNDFLKRFPESLQVSLIKGKILIQKKDYAVAEEIISQLIAIHPDSSQPVIMKARLYTSLERHEDALRLYQRAIHLNPNQLDAYMGLIKLYQLGNNDQKTIETYERVLQVDDSFAIAVNNLAYLYADLRQNLDRALKLALKAQKLWPENGEIADTLGWVYLRRGSLLLAKQYLNAADTINPNNPSVVYHLGYVSHLEKDFPKALTLFHKAITLGLSGKELTSANNLIQEIVDLQDKMATARRLIDLAKYRKAVQLLEDLLRQKGFYGPAATKLAFVYAELNQSIDQAISLAMEAQRHAPDDPEVADALGWAHFKKGSFLLAKNYLGQSIKKAPDDPLFLYHLGVVFFKEKAYQEARRNFEKAIQLGLNPKEQGEIKKLLTEIE